LQALDDFEPPAALAAARLVRAVGQELELGDDEFRDDDG
jgi:hypothetical protein